jgi:hypothetical protein
MEENTKKETHWNYRDYKSFKEVCKIVYRESEKNKHTDTMTFEQKHLQEAYQRILVFEKDSKYGARELTDKERQDLYQAQNMQLQLQIQRHQKHLAFGMRTPGLRADLANKVFKRLSTDEQLEIMQEELNMEEIESRDL